MSREISYKTPVLRGEGEACEEKELTWDLAGGWVWGLLLASALLSEAHALQRHSVTLCDSLLGDTVSPHVTSPQGGRVTLRDNLFGDTVCVTLGDPTRPSLGGGELMSLGRRVVPLGSPLRKGACSPVSPQTVHRSNCKQFQ